MYCVSLEVYEMRLQMKLKKGFEDVRLEMNTLKCLSDTPACS